MRQLTGIFACFLFGVVFEVRGAGRYGGDTPGGIVLSVSEANVTTEIFDASTPMLYNGGIMVSASGGTAPYTYSATINGITYNLNTGYFPGLNSGSITITVTDAAGQSKDTTVDVSDVYPQPSVAVSSVTMPSACGNQGGTFVLTGSGGTPPYTYSIDGGNTFTTNNTFNGLAQGNYPVLIKDANGQVAMIPVNTTSPLTAGYVMLSCGVCNCPANISFSENACNHSGYINLTYYSAAPSLVFSLDGTNFHSMTPGLGGGSFYYDSSGIDPGAYTIYIKDATGVIFTESAVITAYCNIQITYIEVDASCQQSDGSLTVTAINGNPPYTYTIDGVNWQTSNSFTGLSSGNYFVTAKDAQGGLSSILAVVANKCPVVSAVGFPDTCGQGKGMIRASGIKGTTPYQFSLNDGNFQNSNIFAGLFSGTYKVVLRDLNGYSDSTTVTLGDSCINISISTVNATCNKANGSIVISASSGTLPYSYSIDGTHFQPGNTFTGLASGVYNIVVVDSTGLTVGRDTTIASISTPVISATIKEASCADTGGVIGINCVGGIAPFKYSINNGVSLQSDSSFPGLDSALYIGYVIDSNGCTAQDTIHLPSLPSPHVWLGNDTAICGESSIQLIAPQGSGYTYIWQDGSLAGSYTVIAPGTYTVKVTNSFGCSDTASIKIGVTPLPVFSLGDDTIVCSGRMYTLVPAPRTVQGTFLWSDGSGGSTLAVYSPGLYWLRIANNGCASTDSITISAKPSPDIRLGNDTAMCEGQTLLLNAASPNSTYQWQDGSTDSTYTVTASGVYSVKVDENGCDTSGSIAVNFETKPPVAFGGDTTLCVTQDLILDVTYPNSKYSWQDGSDGPQYKVTREGVYSVSVTDLCGVTTDSITVKYENCSCEFYVPNGFTPNGDGRNDFFLPKYKCLFTAYELQIFNRYGQQVFASAAPDYGWDGTSAGKRQPAGTYVWMIRYRDALTGKNMHKEGTVILIR